MAGGHACPATCRGRAIFTALCAWLLIFGAPLFAITLPSQTGVIFQTSGRERLPGVGDWYTTTTSASTDRLHRIQFEITSTLLAANGGSISVTVNDAECNGAGGDEIFNTADPTRFELRNGAGTSVLQTQTFPSGSTDGSPAVFTVSTAGTYQITSVTGAFPISGDATAGLNDDDNAFTVTIPGTGVVLGQLQSTFVQNTGAAVSATFYFFVTPGTPSLYLRNFDADTSGTVTYVRPNGSTVAGTISGNGVWNGAGTLDTGGDTIPGLTLADVGVWQIQFSSLTSGNQLAVEANSGSTKLLLTDTIPTQAGSFAIVANGTRSTGIGVATDHPFTVTNLSAGSDIIDLSTANTSANFTVQLLTSGGAALTDTDGDGRVDTGTLAANQAANFILRVTPTAGAVGPDVTRINAVSFLDQRVDPANNTVLFVDKTTVVLPTISGTVFEDVNYGGGAGRTRAAASGVARNAARVELFDSTGAFVTSTTTDVAGAYSFPSLTAGNYTVRVVNSTVTSSRTGSIAGLLPVQTFRTTASSGTAVAVTDRVGGENPALVDAGNGSTTLAALTTATTTPQSIAAVTLGSSAITGVDFGFNFDTIVSTRDSGQGSLRQFITNANALGGEGSLAQVGQTSGRETTIFMITDGLAHPGLRAGLASQLTSGFARINVLASLPAITGPNTSFDGGTQTANIGDTNAGVLGAGGVVGMDALALSQVARPEVDITDGGGLAIGLNLQGASPVVRRLSIWGFGVTPNIDTSANVRVSSTAGSALIEQNILGSGPVSFTDPGAATRGVGDSIRAVSASNGTIQNNLIGFTNGKGIGLNTNSAGWIVTNNEIRGTGITTNNLDAIDVEGGSGTATIVGNLFADGQSCGVDMSASAGGNLVRNNSIVNNGLTGSGGENAGIRVYGAGNAIDRNIVTTSNGSGILVTSGASTTTITRNSIFNNGRIGIDLLAAGDSVTGGTSPFVTLNDSGDGDTGGNGLLNFPVISAAAISGSNLVLTGFARPGAVLEFFISDNDASGFGEGQTYLVTLTEGSGADADSGTGTYGPAAVNGVAQGTDTTNRFTFTIATPGGVVTGTRLTATATLSSATSEFSGNVTVAPLVTGQTLSGTVYNDTNRNSRRETTETGTGLTLYVKLIDPALPVGSPAVAVATATPATGAYTFTNVAAGVYTLILDDNATVTDTTPTLPASWSALEGSGGRRPNVAVAAIPVTDQDFGLSQGKPVTGRVFADTGAGGGTANNGIQDGGETGLANVTVRLTDNAGTTTYSTATTDGSGAFSLAYPTTLATGTVLRIVEQNLTGYVSTNASVGDTAGAYTRAIDTIAFTLTANASYANVAFGDVPPPTLNTDGAQAALPGSTLYYPHTFTAGTAGTVTFSTTIAPTPATPGWSPVLYRDTNANGIFDTGEPQITGPVAVTAGQVVAVLVKEFVPLNAAMGAQNQTTLTAGFVYANAPAITATLTRRDITTVGPSQNGALLLIKAVDKTSALPGQTLTYTITYTNRGSEPLNTLSIHDTTPAFTTFTSATNSALPANLTAVLLTAPSAGSTGAIRWNFTGTLAPGATGTVSFTITLDQ